MSAMDVRYCLSLFVRRLPLFLVAVTLFTAAGLYFAISLPPVYRATSNILVQWPRLTELTYATVREETFARIQIIKTELFTRESLSALANRFDIYPPGESLTQEQVVDDLRARIGFEFFGQNELGVAISFEADDPDLAAVVANDLAAAVLERDAASRSSRAEETLSFYAQEVERLAANATEIAARIETYKTENLSALPESLEFRRAQQSRLQDRLLMLESEEVSLRNRRSNSIELYDATGTVGQAAQTPEHKLLEDLRIALSTQRAIFAEDSPNIALLQARIAAIQTQLSVSQPSDAEGVAPTSPLAVQLADIDDRLGAITLEKSLIASNLAALTTSIEATPAVETALSELEHELENAQTLYNAALTRQAEASTGEQIQSQLMGEQLLLLERAVPPERHIQPRRSMIVAIAAAAGIGAGLAGIVLIEILQGRVRRPVQLQRVLGIEPLATIPYIRTPSQVWRRRAAAVLAVALVVAGLPLVQLVLAGYGVNMRDLVAAAFARMGVIIS